MLSTKQYSCSRYGKGIKSINGLTRHLNACTKKIPQTTHLQIHYKLHDDNIDKSDEELKDRNQLLDEINYIVRDTTNSPTKNTPRDGLLASEFLLSLRKK